MVPDSCTLIKLHAKSFQSCLTLCDPVDHSLTGSSVHGVLQARILEWVAMPSSGDHSDTEIKPASLMSPALAGGFFTTNTTWEAHFKVYKTVLLTVVTVQCIRSPEFISNYQFVTLTNISSVLPSLVPDSYCSTFCFYELNS